MYEQSVLNSHKDIRITNIDTEMAEFDSFLAKRKQDERAIRKEI